MAIITDEHRPSEWTEEDVIWHFACLSANIIKILKSDNISLIKITVITEPKTKNTEQNE